MLILIIKKIKIIHQILISISNFSEYVILKFNGNIFCYLVNVRANARGWDVRFSYDPFRKKYTALSENGDLNREFVHKIIGNGSYQRGLRHRALNLEKAYLLDKIKFIPQDVVIDCGANVGDLELYFKTKNILINYIAIEPSPKEYECLVKNVYPHQAYNFGLWTEDTTIQFYIASERADSSIIEPANYESSINLPVFRLDNLKSIVKFENIKLLKIEAEGAEPEVLIGAIKLLSKIEYISADCGFERGKNNEATMVPVINFCLSHGFEIVDIYFPRLVILFKKINS